MEEKQLEFFNQEGDKLSYSDMKIKREYVQIKTEIETFRKKKIDNDLKVGAIVYRDETEEVLRAICDIQLSFLTAFTEVVPFEALGKDIEKSREIHITAAEDYKQKVAKALEVYMQNKEITNA
ncbi:MAG: hypothetical protein LBU89_07560 [Fibromonadaceae bacterium]|nr:hypothetical protein [Fibromonadaceae bacterium]